MLSKNRCGLGLMAILPALLLGCATTTPIEESRLPQDILGKDATVGIVWVTHQPVALYHNFINAYGYTINTATVEYYSPAPAGPIDLAVIQSVSEEIVPAINAIDVQTLVNTLYSQLFENAFNGEGLRVELVQEEGLLLSEQTEMPGEGAQGSLTSYPLDFRPLMNEHALDYLMIFELANFGVGRKFNTVFVGPPFGYTTSSCSLIDKNNEVVSHDRHMSEVPAQGEWDVPPDYPALIQVAEESLEKSVDACFIGTFGWAP